jgi:hypothetical protein
VTNPAGREAASKELRKVQRVTDDTPTGQEPFLGIRQDAAKLETTKNRRAWKGREA